MTSALCPGSFDPPTLGHVNIIERAADLFDRVIVAVSVNSTKNTLFTPEERVIFLKEIFRERKNIEVESFQDRLLVDYARATGAGVIVKGLRTIQDYEYEFQMALANKELAPAIETLFMMTEGRYSHLSSSLVKEIAALGGPVAGMVPPIVERRLREKLKMV